MKETEEQFNDRTYVDWPRDKVWVYPRIRNVGPWKIWTIAQATQYLNHLRES